MVCKKASILRLLMLACFGVLLLASSSKGSDDDDGGGAGFTDSSTSLQTSEPVDIFAKDVADLPEELRDFVDLNGETISVKLPKSRDGPIVLPLLAAENKLSFNVFQEETCLEKEQSWQFNYPVENCNSSMDITWKGLKGQEKQFLLQLFGNSLVTLGTNLMGISVNDKEVKIFDVDKPRNSMTKEFLVDLELPECALNAPKYDVYPYESYFDINFSIENVVSEDADKSGKCDITLKFNSAAYKFPTSTTTEEPTTVSTAENTESPDDAIHSTPFDEDERADESSGSFLIWIIVGPIIGLCSLLILGGILLWYFKFRGGSDADDGSTKLEVVMSSAAPTTPTVATSVPFQPTEMTAKEAYGSKRGEIKQSKPEKKLDKKSPRGKKAVGNKKGKGISK